MVCKCFIPRYIWELVQLLVECVEAWMIWVSHSWTIPFSWLNLVDATSLVCLSPSSWIGTSLSTLAWIGGCKLLQCQKLRLQSQDYYSTSPVFGFVGFKSCVSVVSKQERVSWLMENVTARMTTENEKVKIGRRVDGMEWKPALKYIHV